MKKASSKTNKFSRIYSVFAISVLFMPSINLSAGEFNNHSLTEGLKGSEIYHAEDKDIGEYLLPVGAFKNNKISKIIPLHGKITRLTYRVPGGGDTLEIYNNYEAIFKEKGFDILFSCSEKACGDEWSESIIDMNPFSNQNGGEPAAGLNNCDDDYQRYMSAQLAGQKADIFVSLYIASGHGPFPIYQLDIIEIGDFNVGEFTVESLKNEIEKEGKVAVYGIKFDRGEAEIKEESAKMLSSIATIIRDNPRKLYIVGHTDDEGLCGDNIKLSKDRADAVLKALTTEYGVRAEQLESYGVGPLSPLAASSTEEGRAVNSRIELIFRSDNSSKINPENAALKRRDIMNKRRAREKKRKAMTRKMKEKRDKIRQSRKKIK